MRGRDNARGRRICRNRNKARDDTNRGATRYPTRREVLRWGLACGVAGVLDGPRRLWAQDVAKKGALPGPKLKGVARHRAMFWRRLSGNQVECELCPRKCKVGDLERGACGVRENQGGAYQTLVYGTLCSANLDPIEKKPMFHYLPGTTAFSVATAGCNMECKFCQNWEISQFRPEQVESTLVRPERLVALCQARYSPTISYTYSEPIVFYEYMHDSAALARRKGVGAVMISNGYIQEKPLRQLCRQLTGVKIDLKAFSENFYKKQCRGRLQDVLATLEVLRDTGIWFELVVLIIPTLNDSPSEIRKMSKWVSGHLGPNVPMHFSRFHPTYRLTNLPRTPVSTVERCREIALEAGVRYAYVGNVPLHRGENTYCHECHKELIQRVGFKVMETRIRNGKCPSCKATIPGVWSQKQALKSVS